MSRQTENAALQTIKDALMDIDRWLNDAEVKAAGAEGEQRLYWQGAADGYGVMRRRLQDSLRELEAPQGSRTPHTAYSAARGL